MFLQLLLVHMYLVMKTGIPEYRVHIYLLLKIGIHEHRTIVLLTISALIIFMMKTLILYVHS